MGKPGRKLNKAILVFLFALTFSSAAVPVQAAPRPKLNKVNLSMQAGEKTMLRLRNRRGKKAVWKSKNKSIVTVSKKGVVEAKWPGATFVTVRIGVRTLKCKIVVRMKDGTSGLNSETASPGSGSSLQATQTSSVSQDPVVFWTPNGKSYHSSKSCPTLARSSIIESGSLSQCPKTDPCDKCY